MSFLRYGTLRNSPNGERQLWLQNGAKTKSKVVKIAQTDCLRLPQPTRPGAPNAGRNMRVQDKLQAMQIELAQVTSLTAAEQIAGPLATIALGCSAGLRWLAKQPPNLEEVRADLDQIAEASHRASQVIEGIRSMFKNDSREKALLDVNEVIREVIALLRSELQNGQIVVQDELSTKLPPVLADGVQLQQAIAILVANAIEAMEAVDDRTLRVKSAMSDADGVLIMVEDSGPGIDPENADRIF
jgi:signal transduction histidine kinase